MIARAAAVLLVTAAAAVFSGCAQQFTAAGEGESSLTIRPFQKQAAKARAEEFLRAYVGDRRKNFPLQSVTRRADSPGGPYWVIFYSGKDIHTGIFVEVHEQTGRGRIRGFLGNVLVADNTTAGVAGAANPFRTLEDFRARLAEQAARFQQREARTGAAAGPAAVPMR